MKVKFLRKLSIVLCFAILPILLLITGCIDELIATRTSRLRPALQKKYSRPPLEQSKLSKLLQIAAYTDPPSRYGELVMRGRSKDKGLDPVVFSHRTHRVWYTCRVCHIELDYSMDKGGSGITREDHLEGRYCGVCHDGKIAFSVRYSCELCHVSEERVSSAFSRPEYVSLASSLPNYNHGDRIDWVQAIKTGAIQPKQSLKSDRAKTSLPLPKHLEKPMHWMTNVPMVDVIFPHLEHTEWLDCSDCHPDVFKIESFGTEEFDKEKNLYGFYCGICHRDVAFPMDSCNRCHPSLTAQKRGL